MENNQKPSFDYGFGLTEQASNTFYGTQDSNGDMIVPRIQTPTLSPVINLESPPSPKASGDGTSNDLLEENRDSKSTGEAPVGDPTPPLTNSIPDGETSNLDWLNFDPNNLVLNSSGFDFEKVLRDCDASFSDNAGTNSSMFESSLFEEMFPAPPPLSPLFLPPLFPPAPSSPSQGFEQLPTQRQPPLTETLQNLHFSPSGLSNHLPTTIAPQQLHPQSWYSEQAPSPQSFPASPYPNQGTPMAAPSPSRTAMLRAPFANMYPTPTPSQGSASPPTTGMFRAPLASMSRAPVPLQGSPNFLPKMAYQGQPIDPEHARRFLGVGVPPSVPHGTNPSYLLYGNSPPQQSLIPSVKENPQDLAGSPEGSRIGGPRGRKRNAKTVAKYSGEPGPTSNKAKSGLPRGEPQIIHRLKPGYDSDKPWVKTNKNRGLNRRAGRIAAFKPEEIYMPLLKTPAAWDEFTYESTGELAGRRLYEPEEILCFLYKNPHKLTIWLQRNPADSARRYGGMDRGMCRFKNCCADSNTIMPGWYRVTFDENSATNPDIDPMHNAGYVHLYCMEKFLDFPTICHELNVKVDNRALPDEDNSRNKMKYGTDKEVQVALDFVRTCKKTGEAPEEYPPFSSRKRSHQGTLAWLLSMAKFGPHAHEDAMEQQREKKHMSTHEVHLGNLEIYDKYRARAKPKEPQPRDSRRRGSTRRDPSRRVSKKSRRDEYESDESPEPRRRDSTRRDSTKRVSKKRHRDEYESEESEEPTRKHSTRRDSTRRDSTLRDSTRKMSNKRRRDEYESDLSSEESSEELSDHERRRKRQKRSTKEARPKPSKSSKRRREDTPESEESESESESEYERAPEPESESSEDSAEVQQAESSARSQKRRKTQEATGEEEVPNRPMVGEAPEGEKELPCNPDDRSEEELPRKRKSSRMEEIPEEDEPPQMHRKSSRRNNDPDEEEEEEEEEEQEEKSQQRRKSVRDGKRRVDRKMSRGSRGSRHD